MALTATGIGSGLDISNIVKVLVDAEKVPKEAIFNKTEDSIKAKVSAIGTLKSEISKFQDALKKLQSSDTLSQRKISTGDSKFLTATSTSSAQSGSYSVQVERLAKAHKVGGSFTTDSAQTVGEGSLGFTVNGKAFAVAVAATDSLSQIASNINAASDNSGVTATVVTSDSGSRLVFSASKEGPDNQIALTATDTTGTGLNDMFGGANLTTLQTAQTSLLHIDGQAVTSQTNEVVNAIEGVTLKLTSADLSSTTTLSISQDDSAVKENIKGFVDSYNALLTSIDKLSSYDAKTKVSGALQGDSMIRSLESQLRKMVSERVTVNGSETALYEIGLKTDRSGKLSIDDTKLAASIKTNMNGIQSLFTTKDTGIANRFADLTKNYVKAGGLIDGRSQSYTASQSRLTDDREAFSLKMTQLQARLSKQFNAMDLIVGSLNQQSSGLSDRLKSLPGLVRR
ncbi:flagellar hook-associated 2-like protein [Shewanella denitrificans OS217]|uniref:Flagellar hook-associated protein 2 n=1 Tax=Shewanella denitrificans (strain OS217 / ATCC BAA-1090 / DSM 15013) TaxID=318161 RepID=Q12PM3_SHEDO|nr:flagellar filament capping protein FliD [Shewanella denitrificans]ABE54603.1 flagellar hook-associated 2-like protein [Shewanella denitrificans OS217]